MTEALYPGGYPGSHPLDGTAASFLEPATAAAAGAAGGASVATFSTSTVTASSAHGWATAQGGTVTAEDGTAGPTQTALPDTAAVTGSAAGPRLKVVVRPAVAAARASVPGGTIQGLQQARRLRASAPQLIRNRWASETSAGAGLRAGHPVMVGR